MKNNFQVGEIFFLTHGVGELHIEAVMIKKISKGIATVVKCLHGVDFFRDEFEVSVGALIRDRDLIQEVFDYIKANQCKNITQKLFNAIKNNDIDEVKEYIERGADKNARDIRGKTPLMLACQQKKPKTKIVDSLIEAGADVDARDNDGRTAFYYAKKSNNQEIIDLLENYKKLIKKIKEDKFLQK